jgi:Ca2+-binding EF-hand superfamily protein
MLSLIAFLNLFLSVSFKIFDFDGDGYISPSDLTAIVAASLREHGLVIKREDIDYVVKKTFDDVKPSNEGLITFEEYD